MPRTKREASETGIYHVMARGINHQLIFEEAEDYSRYLAILSEVKELSGFKLYAYCLMGNHFHLLIKEGTEPLPQIFRRIGARYAFWFNWKYSRSGHLFQDRFKSEPVEDDEYFGMVLAYIFQNPVKAGLCACPEDYEWSSRRLLGRCKMVDEAELFQVMPLEAIKEREREEVRRELLEPKIGRRMAISDKDAFAELKALSGTESAAGFQSLNRDAQKAAFIRLRGQGASVRQLARLSGLGRGVVGRLCRTSQEA